MDSELAIYKHTKKLPGHGSFHTHFAPHFSPFGKKRIPLHF